MLELFCSYKGPAIKKGSTTVAIPDGVLDIWEGALRDGVGKDATLQTEGSILSK